ncbi:hypothetical protein Syun_019085 [Stephania yunnanensis]|uniref:Uncharacterized protein n=1 Tax=Stephania yunnanensis TaxID=152371 RepID=A0AAP0ITG0_9MAGN
MSLVGSIISHVGGGGLDILSYPKKRAIRTMKINKKRAIRTMKINSRSCFRSLFFFFTKRHFLLKETKCGCVEIHYSLGLVDQFTCYPTFENLQSHFALQVLQKLLEQLSWFESLGYPIFLFIMHYICCPLLCQITWPTFLRLGIGVEGR